MTQLWSENARGSPGHEGASARHDQHCAAPVPLPLRERFSSQSRKGITFPSCEFIGPPLRAAMQCLCALTTLTLQSLFFFFRFAVFLAFLCVFPFFPKDFKGSAEREILVFFRGVLVF